VPCFQAGLLVLRPSEDKLNEFIDTIKEGNYIGGMHPTESGWGGKGYGYSIGCMAVQGVVPYYYDILHPRTAVELDGCIYNHMGMNTLYEPGGMHFNKRKLLAYKAFQGQCRNGRGMNCTDCRKTPVSQVKSVHFTICRKPWTCNGATEIAELVNATKCNELQRKWTQVRIDLEDRMEQSTGVDLSTRRNGSHAVHIYEGICNVGEEGDNFYVPIELPKSIGSVLESVYAN
jgi:hypothetical protein